MPPPWTWRELDAAAAEESWDGLTRFVTWLVSRYDLGDVVPACWWAHGAITEELTALWAAWNAAYLDPEAPGDAPLSWQERFGLCRTRLAEWDRLACAQRGHREEPPVPFALDEEAFTGPSSERTSPLGPVATASTTNTTTPTRRRRCRSAEGAGAEGVGVLSAHKIGSGQIDYYVRYAARGAEAFWLGKGALPRPVRSRRPRAVPRALANGEAPDGGRLLERVAARRTPGWDFTLSAPKSVSLAWALADEELRERLAAAHREATAAAFAFLERDGGRARRGLGGRDGHVGAELAIACFTHPASRELDPQLHTHGILLNVAHGADRRWTALDSRTLYLHRRAAGAIYRAELRQRVAALGGEWGAPDRRGLAELAGVERETLRPFSQRRNAIEADARALGRIAGARRARPPA